jgi:hypothetical protein
MGGQTIGVIHVKCSYVTCPEIWTVDANKYLDELADLAFSAGEAWESRRHYHKSSATDENYHPSYSYPDLSCPRCSDPGLHTLKEDD